jgi:DNA-binding NarL/FixJ family response regulator
MSAAIDTFRSTVGSDDQPRLRLAIVDDHAILRQGLRALLEIEPDLEVVGEAGTARDAVDLVSRTQPSLVLSDIALPDQSGLALIGQLQSCCPTARILMLTAYCSEDYIRVALNSHADGYILKDASRAELLYAIRAVGRGEKFLCAAITTRMMSGLMATGEGTRTNGSIASITGREREVLTRIALGLPNKVIAKELELAVKTVEKHRSNLMRKLSLHNSAEVTMYAVRTGLVSADRTTSEQAS